MARRPGNVKSRRRPRTRALAPVWTKPPVPLGFWDKPENRLRYMRWLGRQLGFRKHDDWYHITTNDFKRNHGATVLSDHWGSSAIIAVKECFPDKVWHDWLFDTAPRRYWHDRRNHRRYMKWLGEKLGYRSAADWYQVTNQDFKDHKGGAFLNCYNNTVSAAVMAYKPRYDWKEWLFRVTPKGFWHLRKNRLRYVRWLANRLGIERASDWYRVTDNDFKQNCGQELLRLFGSPMAILKDCYPRKTWYEWMFARVPVGFWEEPRNRLRYVRWLGKRLRIKRPADWSNVRQRDIRAHYGGALLARYGSYTDLLTECVPGYEPNLRRPES